MRAAWLLGLVVLMGCDDHLFPAVGDRPIEGQGWCAVQEVLAASCWECHSTRAVVAGLDLESSPHDTLLAGLVVPGDPEGSMLMQRLDGSVGGVMPPSGLLPADSRDRVRAWIADGADGLCTEEPPTGGVGPHPPGWADPTRHGMGAKLQQLACRTCHGETLDGDLGPSCSGCHTPVWKEDCTYCHGGAGSDDGSPPEDIDDNTNPALSPFSAHQAHLQPGEHATIPCETCHQVPEDALSDGHLFVGDLTPGVAEVRFTGLATGGTWNAGTCSVRCHGDGRAPGLIGHRQGPLDCSGCHASLDGASNTWDHLSGDHDDHLDEGVVCGACHPQTVAGASTIVGPELHVDGLVQLQLPVGMSRNGNRCTGTCHGEVHDDRNW